MLDIILSHWLTYVYVVYVLVLIVLCVIYRPRVTTFYTKLRRLPPRARLLRFGARSRLTEPRLPVRQYRG
ncbi:MAG TPA: hypothetical protein VH643_15070 [Gemmataceae bacterium]|jgi:hypothetical protein